MLALSLDLGWPSYQQSLVNRWQGSAYDQSEDYVAEEVPVSLVYNGVPHVVMLATPTDLEDFALGFSITEGILSHAAELQAVRIYQRRNGIEVRMRIPETRFQCLAGQGRNLTGRTGCGLCGASTLEQALRRPAPVQGGGRFAAQELYRALEQIRELQILNQLTGAVHAAAWVVSGHGIQLLCEDVGRHNALDKLIGQLLRSGKDLAAGFVLVTSRASYELVQKTARAGIGMLAAISAPTGLAIRLADASGVTLAGFARNGRHVVYSHPQRLLHND